MKKVICKKTYDTESSTLLKKNCFGDFGDPKGFEESLFQTQDGSYFLYTNGGAESKYCKEDIKRVSKEEAKKLL